MTASLLRATVVPPLLGHDCDELLLLVSERVLDNGGNYAIGSKRKKQVVGSLGGRISERTLVVRGGEWAVWDGEAEKKMAE